jgi:hypothetical protein
MTIEDKEHERWLDKQQARIEEERKTRELLMCGRCSCPLEWCMCPILDEILEEL